MMMEKSSKFSSPVLEVIQKRRSRRAFADKIVEPEKIHSLFEAARWAPSSLNEQPWFYVYATKDQESLWNKIFGALKEGNKVWARNAPLLILSLARKNFIRIDSPNPSARYDLGAANAFLSLQAAHVGLNLHQIAGFDVATMITNLGIPDIYEPVTVMAVGYPGDIGTLPENLQMREAAPRERYVENEFVINRSFAE
ncbi:MAG TPA: nitroreductase family protein [Chryseosolibacter sp.]|jgi:nitroreductase|nr:nitroreductase family protein [Chryseosolibacter sp.]